MDTEISKVYSIKLDTKGKGIVAKDINNKSLICNASDSIKIVIELLEDGSNKELGSNCNISLISHIQHVNGSVDDVKQDNTDGSITYEIIDGKTIITIYPKDSFNLNEGISENEIVIADENENISVQHFKFTIKPSLNNNVVHDSIDSINTLTELEEQIKKNEVVLQETTQQAVNMQKQVDDKCDEVDTILAQQDVIIDDSINEMNAKINNMNTTIDTQVLKTIKLNSLEIPSENVIYFATKLINEKAENLINKAFDVHIGGHVYNTNTLQTTIGILNFYMLNNNLYVDYRSLADRNMSGNTVSVEVLFSNKLNYIPKSAIGYKLLFKTKLAKSLNTNDTMFAYITPKSDSKIEWGE